jgi:hypothetical protein
LYSQDKNQHRSREITMSILRLCLALILLALLSGCASGLVVQVNAIANPQAKPANPRYVLVNGNAEGREDDLFFREFSAYFVPLLKDKGYQRVNDRAQADLQIVFRFAVSEGRTGVNTFTHPIYETVGGNTITFTNTKTDSSGTTTTTKGTVYVPMQTQYVGTVLESQTYTLFTSSVVLEALTLEKGDKAPTMIWKTMLSSTSDSNDLRAIMPYMAAAAAPYLGSNSGELKDIRFKPDDPKVTAIKAKAK